MVNRSRVLSNIRGLHQIPNPLSNHPFPSFWIFFFFINLSLWLLRHCFSSLGVQAEPLCLVRRLVECGVVSNAPASDSENRNGVSSGIRKGIGFLSGSDSECKWMTYSNYTWGIHWWLIKIKNNRHPQNQYKNYWKISKGYDFLLCQNKIV